MDLQQTLSDINNIKAKGFRYSDADWASVLIGSSNGLVLNFTPAADQQEAPAAAPSKLQSTVNSSLAAASQLAAEGRAESFQLASVSLSLQGLGFDIPAVISTLRFQKHAADVSSQKAENASEAAPEQPHGWWVTNALSGAYNWTKAQLSSALSLGQRSAFKVGSSVASIQAQLHQVGYKLEGDWFAITVGSYVGVELVLTAIPGPRSAVDKSALTYFQQAILVALEGIDKTAKVTGENFKVATVTLRVTKLGLNIPEVSGTILLRDERDEHSIELKTAGAEEEAPVPDEPAVEGGVEAQLANAGKKLSALGASTARNTVIATQTTLRMLNLKPTECWAAVTVGTSNGSAVYLSPVSDEVEADIEGAEKEMRKDNASGELSKAQQLLIRVATYLKEKRSTLHAHGFAVNTVSLEIAGLGLALPRAFSTIVLKQIERK